MPIISSIRSSASARRSGALILAIAIAAWLLSGVLDSRAARSPASAPGAPRATSARLAPLAVPAKQGPLFAEPAGKPPPREFALSPGPAMAGAGPDAAALRAHFERYVLNALLVPVLDDESLPLRFGDPTLRMVCGTAATVEVNGQPLRPGAAQAGRFTLRWRLDHCLPFGLDGPVLDGLAELDVQREGAGLMAHVRFDDLIVQRDGATVVLVGTLDAHTP